MATVSNAGVAPITIIIVEPKPTLRQTVADNPLDPPFLPPTFIPHKTLQKTAQIPVLKLHPQTLTITKLALHPETVHSSHRNPP